MSNVTVAELTATNLVIVAGKGGVGKTTVTAVLARAAADAGRRVLVVELDGKPTLDGLVPDLEIRHLSAAELLEEYLFEHGFKRIAKRLASTGVIDVIGTAAPGIDDLVVLGKIKQLERSGDWDLIVVDGPAAGHAITFLTAAPGLLDAVRSGPVRDQATDVQALLADPDRCQVVLVTLPETTPVNELVELSFSIEERVGVRLAPIVVNQVDPAVDLPDPAAVDFGRAHVQVDDAVAAAEFRRERIGAQQAELARLAADVPIEQVHLAARPTADITAADVAAIAAELAS
ncbi:MAG: ArsA-related P-loop ATPase [Ilumatobacteraceae bacterium]|nr:ArsA-related P-loop ATPase [Ilumatobacteraceae bacterium]